MFKKYIHNNVVIAFSFSLFQNCVSVATDCSDYEQRIRKWHGSIIVDSIFLDWRNHAHVAIDKHGNKILFQESDLTILPQKGDSFHKDLGNIEYTIVKKDSTYVQSYDCAHMKCLLESKQTER